jgi:hypothetical protein
MSWLFSRALVEDCSPPRFLDGAPSALWSWTGSADAFLSSDKTTGTYDPVSRYGMTFVPLTADRGVASLMSSLEVFLAKRTATPPQGTTQPTIFGQKCAESWQMLLPGTSLPKTSAELQSTKRQTTLSRWVIKPAHFPLARQTSVLTTFGSGIGYLHTPTTKANYCADSMQKWPACAAWRVVFGKVTPEAHEYLMGWPIGWSDLRPLATARCQQWQQQHLPSSQTDTLHLASNQKHTFGN